MMYEVLQRYLIISAITNRGTRAELERYAKQVSDGARSAALVPTG